MAWTSPREWISSELVTASIMNTHVRDNFDYLKATPSLSTLTLTGGAGASSITLPATGRVYLDGGSNTYIVESAADCISMFCGGTERLRVNGPTLVGVYGLPFCLDATQKLYLDGGSNTFLTETSADRLTTVVGGVTVSDYYSTIYYIHTDTYLDATKKLYLDSGGNTYICENTADRLQFVVGGGEVMAISTSQIVAANSAGFAMATWPTTASAANAYVADAGVLSRSTSSRRYKRAIVPLSLADAQRTILALQPVLYQSACPQDDPQARYAGFLAEDVAAVDPVLTTHDKAGDPQYVTYDRIPAYLVPVVQSLLARVAQLEARQEAR